MDDQPKEAYQKKTESARAIRVSSEHFSGLLSEDTFYVWYLKGAARIYQQTIVDTYSSVASVKIYTARIPVTADVLNDRVLAFFQDRYIPILRILTDPRTEFPESPDKHPYELYPDLNDIEYTKTNAKSPRDQ